MLKNSETFHIPNHFGLIVQFTTFYIDSPHSSKMTSENIEKKRKRKSTISSSSDSIPIKSHHLETPGSSSSKPALALGSFGSVTIPSELSFELYRQKQPDGAPEGILLHGEVDDIDFDGSTAVMSKKHKKNRKSGDMQSLLQADDFKLPDTVVPTSQYYVAVYDKAKNSIDLYKAPLVNVQPVAKAARIFTKKAIASLERNSNYLQMRSDLGNTFGTRKAKKMLESQQLNAIDSSVLDDIKAEIVGNIEETTKSLPTQEEMDAEREKDRITPVFVESAETPEDIYPIESILSQKEWDIIRADVILKEESPEERAKLFPYTSPYILSRITRRTNMSNSKSSASADASYFKLLYYLSFLLGVYHNRRSKKKSALQKNLNFPPEALLDSALKRYATIWNPKSRDGNFRLDAGGELKLTSFIAALALRVDGFILEVSPLANELQIKPSKLNEVLYALGCNIKPATVTQAAELKLNKSTALNYKIATLTVPFKAPSLKKRNGPPGRR